MDELWRSDGTVAGTAVVADVCPGPCSADPAELTQMAGRVYFTADDGVVGRELWVSDGSTAGTQLLADFDTGPASSAPADLTPFGGHLIFFAVDNSGSEMLWASDGSPAGTVAVAVTAPPGLPRTPHQPTVIGDRLFFSAWSAAAGQELWVSDGTASGTRQVSDILPGPASSYPSALAAVDGVLLFAADDGLTGSELWASDGTRVGTVRLTDLAPGPASSAPGEITVVGDRVAFAAGNGAGRELWSVDRASLVDLGCPFGGGDAMPRRGQVCRRRPLERSAQRRPRGRGRVGGWRQAVRFLFWFFAPGNLELAVKVLDGRPLNGSFWVLYGALSDVEYWVTVTDRASGESRIYHNAPGTFCGQADVLAFPTLGASAQGWASPATRSPAARLPTGGDLAATICTPSADTLCLQDGRFRLTGRWRNPHDGREGTAHALPQTADSGAFWSRPRQRRAAGQGPRRSPARRPLLAVLRRAFRRRVLG